MLAAFHSANITAEVDGRLVLLTSAARIILVRVLTYSIIFGFLPIVNASFVALGTEVTACVLRQAHDETR